MSSPHLLSIPDLVDRLVAAVGNRQPSELAHALRIEVSGIRKWMKGHRPGRMRPETRDRIVALIEEIERGTAPSAIQLDVELMIGGRRVKVDVVTDRSGEFRILARGDETGVAELLGQFERVLRRAAVAGEAGVGGSPARAPVAAHPPARSPKKRKRASPRDGA